VGPRFILFAILAGSAATLCACKRSVPPEAAPGAANATAMGTWDAWRDLSPLVDVASTHAPEPALVALRDASALLQRGKARSAEKVLSEASSGAGRHWIAVARANLAALHFTTCIRGVAWRLAEGKAPHATERLVDFDESTRLEPGDVSVEALLTNLQEPIASEIPALVIQARIARARVASFTERCPANADVEEMARTTAEGDLAVLAAEGHLTPDLAYLWAGVQMTRFSGAAARPFLLQAQAGGFDHPAVVHMLAAIAFELRELDNAESLAEQALKTYAGVKDASGQAQVWHLRGEIAWARGGKEAMSSARERYEKALSLDPQYVPAVLSLASLALEDGRGSDAVDLVHRHLGDLVGKETMDEPGMQDAAANLEGLVVLTEEPAMVQLVRDALLLRIDAEPDAARRGLRYFFAATLDARLQEYQMAHGHGVLARDEFEESPLDPPMDIDAFLDRVQP